MVSYGFKKEIKTTFDEAERRVRAALQQEGFGILTTIDIQAKMREKLGKELPKHLILGACNPPMAYRAINAEQDVGLLLPCNVILYEGDGRTPGSEDGTVTVAVIKPSTMMSIIENESLTAIAKEAEEKLESAIAALEDA